MHTPFQPDRFSMASCYGPACVSSCPLLVFKRSAYAGQETGFRGACGGGWSLVATGSLANVEPDRIMLKKVRGNNASLSAVLDSLLICFSVAAGTTDRPDGLPH